MRRANIVRPRRRRPWSGRQNLQLENAEAAAYFDLETSNYGTLVLVSAWSDASKTRKIGVSSVSLAVFRDRLANLNPDNMSDALREELRP